MFEVGKRYSYRMIIDDAENSMSGVVERYEHPLLKFADVELSDDFRPGAPPIGLDAPPLRSRLPGQIINVTSPNFISAVREDLE